MATRDRHRELALTLDTMARLAQPNSPAELLVLDSGGRHSLEPVTERFCRERPEWLSFRLLRLDEPGKSMALNAGLAQSCGDTIAMVDDDVDFHQDWLVELERGFVSGADALQGRVSVRPVGFEFPAWWGIHCNALMSGTDYLEARDDLPLPELNGCNMAVRRHAAEAVGPFCEALGPGAPGFKMSEDSEWTRRLSVAGFTLRFHRPMAVWHRVPYARVGLLQLLRRAFDVGVCRGAWEHRGASVRLSSQRLYRLLVDLLRLPDNLLAGDYPQAMYRALQLAGNLGALASLAGAGAGHPWWDQAPRR